MRNVIFKMILLLLVITSLNMAYGKRHIAKVVKIKGKVTQLRPYARKASRVKLNDKLREDTSIVTYRRSFVRIKMNDGSTLSLGPKSKLVVVKGKRRRKAGVISLLKGKLRTKVSEKKTKKSKSKMFLKTRTAAMGVRGTDFQTVYNPDNKITSLVTFKGKVAMAKINDKRLEKKHKKFETKEIETEVERSGRKAQPEVKKVKVKASEEEKLDQILKAEDAVEVKQGQYSGTVQKLEKASKPVKISPVQLTAMYKNDDFKEKRGRSVKKDAKTTEEVMKKDKTTQLMSQAQQEAPPEGFYDAKTGDYAPKAGGYVDTETGLYVPPDKDSEFDQKRGIFIAKKVGKVNIKTGQYVAPEGLKLDAKKGFVVASKKKKKEDKEVLLAMREDLNNTIAQDVVLAPPNISSEEIKDIFLRLSNREFFTKDVFEASFAAFSESLDQAGDVINTDQERNIEANSSRAFELSWKHSSNTNWQPITNLGMKFVDYDKLNGNVITQNSDKLFYMTAGIRYYLNKRWNVGVLFTLDQSHYLEYVSDDTGTRTELTRVTSPKMMGFINGRLYDKGRFSLYTLAGLKYITSKETGDLTTERGFGFRFLLRAQYFWTQKYWLYLSPFIDRESQSVVKAGVSADASRGMSGVTLGLGTYF